MSVVSFDEEEILKNKLQSLKEKSSKPQSAFEKKLIQKDIQSTALKLGKLKISKNKNFENQTLRDRTRDPPRNLSHNFKKSNTKLFSVQEQVPEKTNFGTHRKLKFLSTKIHPNNESDDEDDDDLSSELSAPQLIPHPIYPIPYNYPQQHMLPQINTITPRVSHQYPAPIHHPPALYIPSTPHYFVPPIYANTTPSMQIMQPTSTKHAHSGLAYSANPRDIQTSYSSRSHQYRKRNKQKHRGSYDHSKVHLKPGYNQQVVPEAPRSSHSGSSRSSSRRPSNRGHLSVRSDISEDSTTTSLEELVLDRKRRKRRMKLKAVIKFNSSRSGYIERKSKMDSNRSLHSSRSAADLKSSTNRNHENSTLELPQISLKNVRTSEPITSTGKSKREEFRKRFAKLLEKK